MMADVAWSLLTSWAALMGDAGLYSKAGIDWLARCPSFAQFVVPVVVLQAYFWVRERREPVSQATVVTTIVALTLFMEVGIVAATMGMWMPRM